VAFEVARALGASLDVWVVRKLGAPWQPELGMGAIAEGGAVYLSEEVIASLDVDAEQLEAVLGEESAELERRVRLYRQERPPPDIAGRTVILVDDGIATGSTVRAALQALHTRGPGHLVLATPVATPDTLADLRPEVDQLTFLRAPPRLFSVGAWYEDFRQVSDEEVLSLLSEARQWVEREHPAPPSAS
jgi:putative phosphoribosyl transferase